MYREFTQNKIAQLRYQRKISGRDVSYSIGQHKNYINDIENKKALPSMAAFFNICEYFDITPQEFFDEGNEYPEKLRTAIEGLKRLDDKTLSHVTDFINDIANAKSK